MSKNIVKNLIEKLQKEKLFALQLDKNTNVSQVISFIKSSMKMK